MISSLLFVLPNPAGLRVLAIVSQNIPIVTWLTDPKFLCFNGLRQVLQCGILDVVTSYVTRLFMS